jgi:hypothetical protein
VTFVNKKYSGLREGKISAYVYVTYETWDIGERGEMRNNKEKEER